VISLLIRNQRQKVSILTIKRIRLMVRKQLQKPYQLWLIWKFKSTLKR